MVNDRALAHYGWSLETFLAMTQLELLPPEDRATTAGFAYGPENTGEVRHLRQDGSLIDVLVRSTPAEYGAEPARLEVLQDITQDKKNQAELLRKDQALMQSEKIASIGQLAAGVAHEITNPMGYITGNLLVLAQYFAQMVRFCEFSVIPAR